MLTIPKLSLRASYIIIIAVLSVAPAWLLSTYLIDRFEQIFTGNLEGKLSERIKRISNEQEMELNLLSIQLEQAATDLDLALTVHTGGYGDRVGQHKLKAIMERHNMLSGLLLIDKEYQIIESVPDSALLLELDSVQSWLKEVFSQQQGKASQTQIIHAAPLIEQLEHYGAKHARTRWQQNHLKPLDNDYLLLFFVPLKLSRSGTPTGTDPLVGGLLALLPMQNLIDQLKYTALPTTLSNARIRGEMIYRANNAPRDALLRIQHDVSIPGMESPIKLQYSERRATLNSALDPLASDFANITLISLAIIMVMALVITRVLLKPLNLLGRIVAIYAHGNYHPIKAGSRFNELNHIIQVLAKMATRIRQNQRELELRVEERTAALKASNQELNDALEQLKSMQSHLVEVEKMSLLGQLVAGVAHEINTPVGVALTAASMDVTNFNTLKEKLESNQLKRSDLEQHIQSGSEAGEMVIRNLKRAAELIRTFKEVAVDQSSEQRRVFNLASYLNEVIGSLQAELRRYNVKLNIKGDNDLELTSFPGVFAQIISNLIMNSLKHGFEPYEQYTINISFFRKESTIYLCYQDTGKGVSKEAQNKLFTPFFTTARGQGGTGLGLHIVYNLITMKLGGNITVDGEPGEGLTFNIQFPITPP